MYRDDLYRDPGIYDLEYADQTEDVAYYTRIAAQAGGPILELGCGNGRITLPMARAGAVVHGVDLCRPMLDDLHGRLIREPKEVRDRVTVSEADFLSIEGPPRYPVVLLPFNALHHCPGHREVLALLGGVRRALLPDGRFFLDCYLPDLSLYRRNPLERYEERHFEHPRTGEALVSWERSWWDPLEQIHHVTYIYRHADGTEHNVRVDFRMYFPQELRALLDWGGFRIHAEAADFAGTPLSRQALKWVMELRLQDASPLG